MSGPVRIFVGRENHKFSCAHMTVAPDGSKERLHGHNYQVRVALELSNSSFEKFLNMHIIKDVLEKLCREWNEYLLVAEKNPHLKLIKATKQETEFLLCEKRYVVPSDEIRLLPIDNIVVEALAVEFARRFCLAIADQLHKGNVVGIEVEVTEARGQGATFYQAVSQ